MASTNEVSPLSGSPAGLGTSPSGPATSGLALASNATSAPSKPKSKPRKRVNTAEKRNQHNAIERQRRETLNSKFIHLARLLPSLAAARRPSKSAIVNGSISHLNVQREQRLLAARLLRQLCAERDALAKECLEWRYANGLPGRDDTPVSAWNDEMEEVCAVENEQFGTFAGMDDGAEGEGEGENDGDEDGEEMNGASSFGGSFSMPSFVHPQPVPSQYSHQQQQRASFGNSNGNGNSQMNGEMSLEQAAAIAAQASFRAGPNGLYTPRSSDDVGMNGLPTNSSLFSGSNVNAPANPWAQLSLHDLQTFAAATSASASSLNAGNGNGNGASNNTATDMFVPPSLSSSTASLPFNAFMSDDSVSPGSNSGYSHIPTPPQTSGSGSGMAGSVGGNAFMASLPTVQHTPSPGSSHSFDDAVHHKNGNANGNIGIGQGQHGQQQWTEQQLMLLRALQQQNQQRQQHQQQQQQQQQQRSQSFDPLSLTFANNAAAAFALSQNMNGNGNASTNISSSPSADSPFGMFSSVFTPQSQQSQQQMNIGADLNSLYSLAGQGGNGNANGNSSVPPPPPLTRAQTENLEAWRKISAMPVSWLPTLALSGSWGYGIELTCRTRRTGTRSAWACRSTSCSRSRVVPSKASKSLCRMGINIGRTGRYT